MANTAKAVLERRPVGPVRDVYHLVKGRRVIGLGSDWVDVWCGGGIAFPGLLADVSLDQVCADCRTNRRTARRTKES